MLNLARFYKNRGYIKSSEWDKSTFLHNIYYQYLSFSYKNAHNLYSNSNIDINLIVNDARNFVSNTQNTYNFVFLDAFTPAKCPALWTLEFFKLLYDNLEDDGIILTYSNSAAIRNAFLQAGFFVGKTYDPILEKFVGTIACKNKNKIEHDLSEKDLSLIKSKAGVCYRDYSLNDSNDDIIKRRKEEVSSSSLISSSQVMKSYERLNKVSEND